MATVKKSRGNSGTSSNSSVPAGYKEIKGKMSNAVVWKKGVRVEGKIVAIRDIPKRGKMKKPTQMIDIADIKTGEIVSVWHSAAIDAVFKMKKGAQILLVYAGEKKIPGQKNPMHDIRAYSK